MYRFKEFACDTAPFADISDQVKHILRDTRFGSHDINLRCLEYIGIKKKDSRKLWCFEGRSWRPAIVRLIGKRLLNTKVIDAWNVLSDNQSIVRELWFHSISGCFTWSTMSIEDLAYHISFFGFDTMYMHVWLGALHLESLVPCLGIWMCEVVERLKWLSE
jgi:hypothetical protein